MNVSYNRQFDDEALCMVLGERLNKIRISKGLTIKQLANNADIEKDGYRKIEKGERKVSVGLLCKITIALDINPADLFDDKFYDAYNDYVHIHNPEKLNGDLDYGILDTARLGLLLKDYRTKHKLSQKKLEHLLNLKNGVINNVENGRGKVNKELIISCSELFDMTPSVLIKKLSI